MVDYLASFETFMFSEYLTISHDNVESLLHPDRHGGISLNPQTFWSCLQLPDPHPEISYTPHQRPAPERPQIIPFTNHSNVQY